MMRTFIPKLDVLPPEQQRIWPQLSNAPKLGLTLYGGTAIALRLGHRESMDFDFFTNKPIDREVIRAAFPFASESTPLQDEGNTWVFVTQPQAGDSKGVKISFFGTVGFGRVGIPERTADNVLLVASLDDLMATKLKVILQRAEAKDYREIAAMLAAGVSLERGLSSASKMYGPNFQPGTSLRAMTYFDDGNLSTLSGR